MLAEPSSALIATPERRPGLSDVFPLSGISGLSFDSPLLSTLLVFFLILSLFLCYLFSSSSYWSIPLNFFQKILQYVSLRDRPFLYGSCLAARRSKSVGGMCSSCHMTLIFAVTHFYTIFNFLLLQSVPFFFFF